MRWRERLGRVRRPEPSTREAELSRTAAGLAQAVSRASTRASVAVAELCGSHDPLLHGSDDVVASR